MDDLTARAESRRIIATAGLDAETQRRLGQFFTPVAAAALIASIPRLDGLTSPVRVLDPGAGSGSLTAALVARLAVERPDLLVHVVAVETDPLVLPALAETLADCEKLPGVTTELVEADYLQAATGLDADPRALGPFDLVVMNPPYGKLAASHSGRRAVARETIDVPNLYAAFWALSVQALASGGQAVAIVPRSWANGTYFAAFRRWLLDRLTIDRLHIFESRSMVFADTGVLQENVIVSGTRGHCEARTVTLSASVGHTDQVQVQTVSSSAVVQPGEPHAFVRFTDGAAAVPSTARYTLDDLGVAVSTGRVVDFRARDWLVQDTAELGTAPLVYPGNLRRGEIEHPRAIRKSQALRTTDQDARKLLVPAGCYTLVKRFSAKEERRRVVAAVWDRDGIMPAFENHLNYFHEQGKGLPPSVARGLSAWLNSTAVDALFRTFSGHTQVNAGDLRSLPYPRLDDLAELGRAVPGELPDQDDLDALVSAILADRPRTRSIGCAAGRSGLTAGVAGRPSRDVEQAVALGGVAGQPLVHLAAGGQ